MSALVTYPATRPRKQRAPKMAWTLFADDGPKTREVFRQGTKIWANLSEAERQTWRQNLHVARFEEHKASK